MKSLLLLALISVNANALIVEKHYKVTSQVMWKCPDGYAFSDEDRLCYPPQKAASVNDEVNIGLASTEKHIEVPSDKKSTINIYNYNGAGKLEMPPMDIVGVKRRKELDKKAVHAALDKALEGKFYEEEGDNELDLDE